ncbi:MAG: DNA helicase PriA [Bacilli bacterium]|nr:DNA helicase PriA [Bacilli bacterium]
MAEEKVKKKKEDSLENRCPSCRASIKFNPKLGKWKCVYCGSEFTLEEMQSHSDNASTEKKNRKDAKVEDDNIEYVSYHCESCGAEIIADSETAATFCVYCGNTAILQSKLSGKFSPDLVIPFKNEKKDAIEAFKGLSKGRPLMPKDFNNEQNIEKIRGIYIPFWLFDINNSGDIEMSATTVETWRIGNTHYTKTNYYRVIRGGTIDYIKIPIDGSTRFENDIMNTIEPFNYNELVPYNHAYLSGFYAERYDQEAKDVFAEAADRSINSTKEVLKNDTGHYTTKTITKDTIIAKENKRYYAMLPVWMVNVKYKDKMYIFAMNGQTGEFIGNIPLDVGKAFLYFFIIFISIFAGIMIFSLIIYLLGGAML